MSEIKPLLNCPKGAKTEEEIIQCFDPDETCMHCDNFIIEDGLIHCKFNRCEVRE